MSATVAKSNVARRDEKAEAPVPGARGGVVPRGAAEDGDVLVDASGVEPGLVRSAPPPAPLPEERRPVEESKKSYLAVLRDDKGALARKAAADRER